MVEADPELQKQASDASGWDDDGDGWDDEDPEDSEMQGEPLACQFADEAMPAPNDKCPLTFGRSIQKSLGRSIAAAS